MPPEKKIKTGPAAKFGPRAQKTRARIMVSMLRLLADKEYIFITTSELAKHAKVNEGLIYHYFKNKDDVFWSVLEEYMVEYIKFVELHTCGVEGALNKIRKFVWANVYFLTRDHPGGKILLLEVRINPNYYKTPAFALTVRNRAILLEIINQGLAAGEIAPYVHPHALASTIIGALEHAVLPTLTHKRVRDLEIITDAICTIIFKGIGIKDDLIIRLWEKMDTIEQSIQRLEGGSYG